MSFECRLRRGATVVDGWEPCVSPQSVDLAGQPDGELSFDVRAVEVFGVAGPAATAGYVLDTTPPQAPDLTQTSPVSGADTAPVWAFTAATTEEAIYDSLPSPLPLSIRSIAYAARSTAEVGELVAFAGTRRYASAATVAMSDWATHAQWPEYPAAGWQLPVTLNIYAVNRSGAAPEPGELLASTTRAFTIPWRPEPDPTCPVGESGSKPWRGPDGVCRTNLASTITFDLGALHLELPTEVIYGVAFNTDGNGAEPRTNPGPYDELNLGQTQAAPTAGSDGEAGVLYYNSTFGGFYADGGKGDTGTFRRDTGWHEEPAIELVAGEPPQHPAISECRLTRGEATIYEWAPCSSPLSYDLSQQPGGTYTFAVRETDAAGNTGPAATASYTLERAPPPPPVITARPASPSSARALSWSFSGAGGASFECRLASASLVAAELRTCSSPFELTLTGVPDGTYRFEVRQRDAFGVTGAAAGDDHVLDTTAPAAPVITRAPRSPGSTRAPRWSFSAESGALTQCRLERAGAAVSEWSACAGSRRYELTGAPLGKYRFAVRASDTAGNQSTPSFSTYVLQAAVTAGPKPGPRPPGRATPGAPQPASGAPSSTGASPGATTVTTGGASSNQPTAAKGPVARAAHRRPHARRPRARAVAPGTSASAPARPLPPQGRVGGSWVAGAPKALVHTLASFASAAVRHPDKSFFPLSLILLVAAFLLVQGRIDKSDPKLALAPVYPDPDLEFPPPSPSRA